MHTILVIPTKPVELPTARGQTLEDTIRQTLIIQLDMDPYSLGDYCSEARSAWEGPTLDTLRDALVYCLSDPQLLIIHLES